MTSNRVVNKRAIPLVSSLLIAISSLVCAQVSVQPAVAADQTTPGMTNDDVVTLSKMGFGNDVIEAKIQQAGAVNFKLEVDDLSKLKAAGVAQSVISAMLKRSNVKVEAPAAASGARGSLFNGEWVNENKHTDGTTRLRVTVRLNLMSFEAWGKCQPVDCSMGTIATIPTSDADTGQVNFRWTNSFSVRQFQIRLVGPSRLEVQTTTTFTDNSGRPKYSMLEYMVRE